MDLNNKNLVDWLKEVPAELFPQGKVIDFYTSYKKLHDYLLPIHNEVTTGASLKDANMLLNDHGPEHIATVINRASLLVQSSSCILSPYEVYILLCCIEIHDIGNIFGRYQHEKNATKIIQEARNICGEDTIEAMLMKKIAETHGGKLDDGNKDKITLLEEEIPMRHGVVRARLLAAILRFADELADDKTRANSHLLKQKMLPKGSEVFHAYAMCLDTVVIKNEEKSVHLAFSVPDHFLKDKFGKINEEVYLIDEIYERLLKMHYEREYCMRFTRGHINIDSIRVDINFYNQDELDESHPRMVFFVQPNGYPDNEVDIFKMCPQLIDNNVRMDGNYFKNKLSN